MKTLIHLVKIPAQLTGIALVVVGGCLLYGPRVWQRNNDLFNEAWWSGRQEGR